MFKRVTLGDIAADAGVSKATVSAVLNDSPAVADGTRARVSDSIQRLGYIYDRAAASLRKKQTDAVGMIVTTLTNPYFAEFAEGIQGELDAKGVDVLLGVTSDDVERQTRLLRSMEGRRVDGIVLVPAHDSTAETLRNVMTPLLLLARRVETLEVDYVGGDNTEGCRAATEHLIETHRCRNIVFLGGDTDSSSRIERLAGYHAALEKHGLPTDDGKCLSFRSDRRIARERARASLEAHAPDGVVCYNDLVAFGVMDAAHDLGLKIGEDVRVIGFDDVEDAALFRPPLASVAVSARVAGRRAAELLLSRGSRTAAKELILPAELRPRESCGCASSQR